MVCKLIKRDNTDLTDLTDITEYLNKILGFDAWIAPIRDVAVLDETLDGSRPWYYSNISSLPECKGIGPKTLDRIGKDYTSKGPFKNLEDILTRVPWLGTQRYNSTVKAFLPAKATFWNLKNLSNSNEQKINAIVTIMKMHHETDIFFLQEVAGKNGQKAVELIVNGLNGDGQDEQIWAFRTSGFPERLGTNKNEQYAVIWKQTGRLGKKSDDYPRNYLTFQKGVVSTLKENIKDFLSLSSDDENVEGQIKNCFDELMEKFNAAEMEPPSLDQDLKFQYPIWRVSFGDTHYAVHHTSTDSTENKQELLIMQTLTRWFYELKGTPIYTGGDFNIGEAKNLGFAHQHLNMLQVDFPNRKQTVLDICPHPNNTNWFISKAPGVEWPKNPSYNDNVMSGVKCVVTVLPVTDNIKAVLSKMLEDIKNRPDKPSRAGLGNWIDHRPLTLLHECH